MNPAVEKKRVGAKIKQDDPNEDPKKRANRERQRKYRQNVGKQIGSVVDEADKCEEERKELKEEKADLQAKVASLTTLLKTCDDQVADILKSVNSMKNMRAKSRPKSAPAVSAPAPAGMKGMKMRKSTKVKIAVPVAERPLPTNQFSSRGVPTTTFSKRTGKVAMNVMYSKRQ